MAKVIYPGLPEHPGYEIMKRQARGFGAMLTFQLSRQRNRHWQYLARVRMIKFAESLGGVETLHHLPDDPDPCRCTGRDPGKETV